MAGPHRWIATTPSSWAAGSFDTNLLPGGNEIVRFDGTGQGDVIGGLNQTAVDLDLLEVHATYFGRIGNDGNPLVISADQVVYQGRGTMHYQDGDGATDVMVIQSDNLQQAVKLYSGLVSRLRINKGRVILGPLFTTTIADLEVGNVGQSDSDARLESLVPTSSRFTRLRMNSGYMTGVSAVGLSPEYAVMSGGTWRCAGTLGSPLLLTGGTINWDNTLTGTGTSIAQTSPVHIMGGTLDARRGGAKAISDLYLWPQGQFLYNGDTITVTTTHRMAP